MKIEIINKPMLCWDDDEADAREFHVLAKVTECNTEYPYKTICNKNTYPDHPEFEGEVWGWGAFKHTKPLSETIELTVADISKFFGKTVKIIE